MVNKLTISDTEQELTVVSRKYETKNCCLYWKSRDYGVYLVFKLILFSIRSSRRSSDTSGRKGGSHKEFDIKYLVNVTYNYVKYSFFLKNSSSNLL